MKHNIILIGFMGCGKTSIGERLAGYFHAVFLDTDHLIEEKEEMAVSEIFEEKGEPYFRNLETEVIQSLLQSTEPAVIATGGGLPVRKCNADILKQLGMVVHLNASRETTIARVEGDHSRPLLEGGSLEERVERLLSERMPCYSRAAHIQIDTDGRPFSAIVDEIVEEYEKYISRKGRIQ